MFVLLRASNRKFSSNDLWMSTELRHKAKRSSQKKCMYSCRQLQPVVKMIFWHFIVVCWFACCECFALYCVNSMSHRQKHLFHEHVNSNLLYNILHGSIQKHSIFEISAVISDFSDTKFGKYRKEIMLKTISLSNMYKITSGDQLALTWWFGILFRT